MRLLRTDDLFHDIDADGPCNIKLRGCRLGTRVTQRCPTVIRTVERSFNELGLGAHGDHA